MAKAALPARVKKLLARPPSTGNAEKLFALLDEQDDAALERSVPAALALIEDEASPWRGFPLRAPEAAIHPIVEQEPRAWLRLASELHLDYSFQGGALDAEFASIALNSTPEGKRASPMATAVTRCP